MTAIPEIKVSYQVLEKLEWSLVLEILAGNTQTDDGRQQCLELKPHLKKDHVERHWRTLEPIKNLFNAGHKAPIGSLSPIPSILKAAQLGQVLSGKDLRVIFDTLASSKRVSYFAAQFGERCQSLTRFKSLLYPLPKLATAIEKAVGTDGELLDTASDDLQRIRRQKISMRQRIEDELAKLMRTGDWADYLQDDFFTVRNERYVVPVKLDGRGRVRGMILDTSASEQTLFIEPASIAPLNEELLDIFLAEKIEILRIFKALSEAVRNDAETLQVDYDALIELDVLTAQAMLACATDSGSAVLTDEPIIDLINARHPLVRRPDGTGAVPSTVDLSQGKNVLIVSGPNAGGKTVVLKTVGLIHLMAKAGLLIPVDQGSRIYLFENIFVELGDAQSLTANLSTFSGHLLGIKPILERAKAADLVLLDELAVGTEPQTGSAIAQAVLETLADQGITTIATTHFDSLKGLAVKNARFRNASMEFSLKHLKPTYRLILDVPGQSYGLEVAEQIGFPKKLIDRARELRGATASQLDEAVMQLSRAREEAVELKSSLEREKLEAEAAKLRWDDERKLIDESRKTAALKIRDKYDREIRALKDEFEEVTSRLRQAYKKVGQAAQSDHDRQKFLSDRKTGEQALDKMGRVLEDISSSFDIEDKLPGTVCSFDLLRVGTEVWVIPLGKKGSVTRTSDKPDDPVEVQVGLIKLRVGLQDLRYLSDEEKKPQRPAQARSDVPADSSTAKKPLGVVIKTVTNSVDLRGLDVDDALKKTWQFLDQAILSGESNVILIHGHGTDRLKTSIRKALQHDSPYDLKFRPGDDSEGGDGVTVVMLR